MSLRERATVDITDVLNESDDSDQEYMLNQVYLCGEIDIANFYRKLRYGNRLNNPWNRRQKSVTVQTDPEILNITPSWLIEGEKLVDELYTGLGNIINSVYNNPQSVDKKDGMKRASLNTPAMKYFTFENGYWRSTLLPNIKIPDSNETNARSKFLCSDYTKSRLFHLFDIATKLRNVISNVTDFASDKNITSNVKIQQSFNASSNGEPLSEFEKSQSRNGISNHDIYKTNSLDDLEEIWRDLEEPMVCHKEDCVVRKPLTKRARKDSYEVVRKKHVVLDDSCGSDDIPGVKVMRYALASRDPNAESKVVRELRNEDKNATNSKGNFSSGTTYATKRQDTPIEVSLPSCSKTQSKIHQCDGSRDVTSLSKREKRPLYDQENCIKSKSNRGNSEKDFIRKNILDLKNKYNRSTPAVVKNYKSDISGESSGMTKNGHRAKS